MRVPLLAVLAVTQVIGWCSAQTPAFQEGVAMRAKGDLPGALEAFTRAVKASPGDAEAWRQRGLVLYSLKRYEEASKDFLSCIKLDPGNSRAWLGLGSARRAQRQSGDALAAYHRAIELDPRYANAYLNRGGLYYETGRPDEALRDYDRALELDPNNALALHSRGVVKSAKNDIAGAQSDIRRALELDPNHALAAQGRQMLAQAAPTVAQPAEPAPAPSPVPGKVPQAGAGSASADRTAIPARMLTDAAWPAELRFRAPAQLPPAPAPLGRAAAHLPENQEVRQLAPAAQTAVIVAAKEATRALLGELDEQQTRAFELKWAPYFDYPCGATLDYFAKLNPLLTRMLEARTALGLALEQFSDAYEEAITAAGLEDEAGVVEAMAVAGVHRESIAALHSLLVKTSDEIEALGEPPDPLPIKAKAAKTHADAARFIRSLGGNRYWVLVSQSAQELMRFGSDENIQHTLEVAEGLAKGSHQSRRNGRRTAAVGEVTWSPLPRVIPVPAGQDLSFTVDVRAACSGVQTPEALPGYLQDSGCVSFILNSTADDCCAEVKPGAPAFAGARRFHYTALGEFRQFLPFEVQVKVGTPGGHYQFLYKYDLRQLTPDQVAALKDLERKDAAARNQAIAAAGARHDAAMSDLYSAQVEEEARAASIAFARANQAYFRAQADDYRARAQAAQGAERDRYEYLAMVMEANLQAEIDNQRTMETGEWTRTRTAYDDWNFRFMAAQGQMAARDWANRSAAMAAVPRLIAQLPKELQDSKRFTANIALEAAVKQGDTAAVQKMVNSLAEEVKGYWTRRGQAQMEMAETANTYLERAETIRSGADKAMFALSFFGGAGVYTAYMVATGGIDAYHAVDETGEKGGVWGGVKGAARGAVASIHPSAMVALSAYDGYHQTYQDPKTGQEVKGGVSGALYNAGYTAAFALAMQKVVAPGIGRLRQRISGPPPQKWPTVEQQLGEARFQSRMANGRAKVKLFQQRAQLLRLARSSSDAAAVAKLRAQAEEAAKAIKCDHAAKMALNQSGKQDPATMKMYLAMDSEFMAQVQKDFQGRMAGQGYALVEVRAFSNSASSGRAGMDVDLGIVEPPRYIRSPDGRVMKNPVWDHWRRTNLTRTGEGGSTRRVSLADYERAGQQNLQASFDAVYGGPGRSTREGYVNFTTSQHAEAYTDPAWIGRRGLPHADFETITPGSAQQAGDVTAFKIGHAEAQTQGRNPDYLTLQENCRTLVKDMDTKLIGAAPGRGPAVNPNAPLARADAATQQHVLRLRDTMNRFANNKLGPIEADRELRQLTGGEGLPAVVRQYQDLLFSGSK